MNTIVGEYFITNKKPLSRQQIRILRILQGGGKFVTTESAAFLCDPNSNTEEQISLRLFFNLTRKGIIAQQLHPPFNFVLTNKGNGIILPNPSPNGEMKRNEKNKT